MRTSLLLVASFAVLAGCTAPSEPPPEADVESIESDLTKCAAPTPLVLTPVKTKRAIEDARVAFNAAQVNGGSWQEISSVALFRYTKCMSTADLASALPSDTIQTIQSLRGADTLDRLAIEGDRFLSGPSGAPLLGAIDAWVGPTRAASATGTRHWDEVPCHNCTDHMVVTVIHVPAARRVVVLSGKYGWDS